MAKPALDPAEVRKLIDRIGLKNVRIASALGVHGNTVSVWLNSGRIPSSKLRKLRKWAEEGVHPKDQESTLSAREERLDQYSLEELVAAIQRKGWKIEGLKMIER